MRFELDPPEQRLLARLEKRDKRWRTERWFALACCILLIPFELWQMLEDIRSPYQVVLADSLVPQEPYIQIARYAVFEAAEGFAILVLLFTLIVIIGKWNGTTERSFIIKLLKHHIKENESQHQDTVT